MIQTTSPARRGPILLSLAEPKTTTVRNGHGFGPPSEFYRLRYPNGRATRFRGRRVRGAEQRKERP
jgi:hypothetical protein